MDQQTLDIRNNMIVTAEGEELLTMEALATEALYSLERSVHITAEATSHCKENTFASGCLFCGSGSGYAVRQSQCTEDYQCP